MNQEERSSVQVVFFSGTGGTKRIAEAFEKELVKRNKTVEMKKLGAERNFGAEAESAGERTELYILLYPVYAFDAPKPVYDWIEQLGKNHAGKNIAVISVSGGGEVWPNTGCRNNCCAKLEEKGMQIIYDNMMCMPANMLTEVSDHLAMHLIKVIPEKVNKALDDILSGQVKRTHFHKSSLRNFFSNMENKNAYKFAQDFTIGDKCNGCGWCAKNCPMGNIVISEETSRPEFLDQCIICMRCIYGCPLHAIKSKSSAVFKNGFDLDAIERRMEGVELESIEACCRGIMFKGVKDYLQNKY